MKYQQINNSHLTEKISLRLKYLPSQDNIKVLDCFNGDGIIWNKIKNKVKKNIEITPIEIKQKKGIYLKGDNIKYLMSLDLNKFDIIDLDAYGIPFAQLEIIFNKKFKNKIIYFTFIQSVMGKLPNKLLIKLNYSKEMIIKCPTIFNKNGFEKICNYIALNQIKNISYININNKYYCCIKT